MSRLRRWMAAAVLPLVSGCSDITAVRESVRPSHGPTPTDLPADEPVPWPVKVHYAGLRLYASTGTVDASMSYDGFHAAIAGTATHRDPSGSSNYTFAPARKDTWGFWNFRNNFHSHSWTVPVALPCGNILWADMSYTASVRALLPGSGLVTLLEDSRTRTGQDSQDECPTEDITEPEDGPGSGSGGGFGDTPDEDNRPRRICVYRYYYNVETGAVLYRVQLFCY